MAAKAGDAEAVKEFLAAGTDVKRVGGFTPLHWAALHGHKEIAELLITNGVDVNATTAWGSTPLHKAAQDGHKEIVELLIAKGADVNAKAGDNDTGDTPLHKAAFNNHKEIAELLIAKGADVNAKNNKGITPLDKAKYKPELADLIRKHGGKTSDWLNAGKSIHIATKVGHIEAVKQHLAAGTDVDARDRQDKTPLHPAAQFGHKEIAELLIAAGADVHAKDKWGFTPLHQAARSGRNEIVGLLIAKGADVNAKDKKGKTPLDWTGRRREIADLLRQHGGKTGEELKAEGK
jgi:cytohesin